MKGRPGAAVLFTSERRPEEPGAQELVLDLRATAVERMALLYSLHLRLLGVASVLFYPGFSRTDAIGQGFAKGGGYFDGWTEEEFLTKSGSIQYAGRAAAALVAEGTVLERTGMLVTARELADEHGFTDVNGRRPEPI